MIEISYLKSMIRFDLSSPQNQLIPISRVDQWLDPSPKALFR